MSTSETPPRLRFSSSRRLQKRREFLRLQQQGKRFDIGPFLAFVLPITQEGLPSKIGITTTKRVGSAVFRNRLRRLIREAARRLWLPSNPPWDVVFVAKQNLSPSLSQADADRSILRLLQRVRSSPPHP